MMGYRLEIDFLESIAVPIRADYRAYFGLVQFPPLR